MNTIFQSTFKIFIFSWCLMCFCFCKKTNKIKYDVIVLGGGTGAVTAAIAAGRNGANTLYINPLPWHGGMLTSAGVSATDGNHNLPSGLWKEWRQQLRDYYGGADSLFTGWVSNTMYEPHIGERFWRKMVRTETLIDSRLNQHWASITRLNDKWELKLPNDNTLYTADVLIDGTDLGDVAVSVGATYDLGIESKSYSNEGIAPATAIDIIQDLTYAAILKDYGPEADKTIEKPKNYDASNYNCSCAHECDDPKAHPCKTMLEYGRLPNDKYMINWPINGNDYYANVIEATLDERKRVYEKAKQATLGFVYYIQTELGYKNLGLADDEFPTEDKLAIYPYHREGRRIKGLVRFNLNHIERPFDYNLYKTGIAVGDYPVDHHNTKSKNAPKIEFPSIPSFNIPMGAIISEDVDNLLVADKAISVSNIANGSTRLQPVVIQIGQAAGTLAAIASKKAELVSNISVRELQDSLLNQGVFLLPYQDVSPDVDSFEAIQRIGATGILRGEGVPYKWANKTLFYPDSIVDVQDLLSNLAEFDKALSNIKIQGAQLETAQIPQLIEQIQTRSDLPRRGEDLSIKTELVTRAELAVLLDKLVDPFRFKDVGIDGGVLE